MESGCEMGVEWDGSVMAFVFAISAVAAKLPKAL